MYDEYDKWLRVLGLAPGAPEHAIKEAYRDLVKVWHPDRFATDARLREKAEDKLRELNTAFAYLENHPGPDRGAFAAADRTKSSDARPERGAASSTVRPRGETAALERWMYGRLSTTLIVAAAIGAVGVWTFLASRRAVEKSPEAVRSRELPAAE